MNLEDPSPVFRIFIFFFSIFGFVYFWWWWSGEQVDPKWFNKKKNPDIWKKTAIRCIRIIVLLIIVLGALLAFSD